MYYHYKSKILFLLFTVFLLTATSVFSQNNYLTITDFTFEGLRKTNTAFMLHEVKHFKGKQADPETINEIEAFLQAEGIFSTIDITVIETGTVTAEIHVKVTEKISFIPIPFATYTDSGFYAGGMVLDTNAMGVKASFIAGGIYAGDSGTLITAFTYPSMDITHPGISLNFIYSDKSNNNNDGHGDKAITFDSKTIRTGISVLLKINQTASADFGLSYDCTSTEDDVVFVQPVESMKTLAFKGSCFLNKNSWNGYFLSAKNIGISSEIRLLPHGEHRTADAVSAKFNFEHPLVPRIRFISSGGILLTKDTPYIFWESRNYGSVTILDSHFVTPEIKGITAGIEVAAAKTGIGLVSVYGNAQGCICEDIDGSELMQYGYEGGARLYLSKIAMPAFSTGFCYNAVTKKQQFSVSLGASF